MDKQKTAAELEAEIREIEALIASVGDAGDTDTRWAMALLKEAKRLRGVALLRLYGVGPQGLH